LGRRGGGGLAVPYLPDGSLARLPDAFNGAVRVAGVPVPWGPSEFTCTGIISSFDVTDRLREITVPTPFTCGSYDEAKPAATAN